MCTLAQIAHSGFVGHGFVPQASLDAVDVAGLPLPGNLLIAQAQSVMVLLQGAQCLGQQCHLQRAAWRQQHGLVPVLQLRDVAGEKHLLDRRQRHLAAHWALVDLQHLDTAGNGCQLKDGLAAEDVFGGDMNARLTRPADHLDGDDRVTAKFEEVVADAHPLDTEQRLPDFYQLTLDVVGGGAIVGLAADVGLRQCLVIQLAVGGQRQRRQQQQMARHLMRCQLLAQPLTDPGQIGLGGDQISHQLFAGRAALSNHGAFTHLWVALQAGLHLARFDPVAANLDLMIDPANELQQAIGAVARLVTGAVQPRAIGAERVGHEALGGHARAQVIAAGDAGTAQVQLTGTVHRQRASITVEHIGAQIGQRPPQRQACSVRPVAIKALGDGADRGLGRAVMVDHAAGRGQLLDALQQAWRAGFAAQHQALPGDDCGVIFAKQRRQVRRHDLQHIDLFVVQISTQGAAIDRHVVVDQVQGLAVAQRAKQHGMTKVSGHGRDQRHAPRLSDRQAFADGCNVVGQRAVADGDALGATGGAGSKDDIGQLLRVAERRQRPACAGQRLGRVGQQLLVDAGQLGKALSQRRLHQQVLEGAVGDHLVETLLRVLGRQRHIGAAGLEHCQQADDHLQRTLGSDTDQYIGAHALLAQAPGQGFGLAVELGIAEAPCALHHSDGLRCGLRMGTDPRWYIEGALLQRAAFGPLR
ncbi:hypothetical protein PS623_04664 [Pseudomonas fluorescens]|nr:hypothetical protein PS623_04664 [Pseudomonas fluorescens]